MEGVEGGWEGGAYDWGGLSGREPGSYIYIYILFYVSSLCKAYQVVLMKLERLSTSCSVRFCHFCPNGKLHIFLGSTKPRRFIQLGSTKPQAY